jgi:hypothetical protein
MQSEPFMMIEVCEDYFQRGIVICLASEVGQSFAIICWQFVIGWLAIKDLTYSVENQYPVP